MRLAMRVWSHFFALSIGAVAASAQYRHPPGDTTLRLVISTAERRLWVIDGAGDTAFRALVAVGRGKTMVWKGKRWTFATPPGEHRVLSKEKDPRWIPPLWHYVEAARARRLTIAELTREKDIGLSLGRRLAVRRDSVGVFGSDSLFRSLSVTEFIVFDGVLYVPPFGTANRAIAGVLGAYRLNLGRGFGLHGTSEHGSIPQPVTHGCVRLHDADIEWLYRNIAIGSRVTVY